VTHIKADFFISRAGADAATAKLIAGIIRGAGKIPFSQDEDFGSADFMRRMEQAYEGCERVVALLSPHYQQSEHCRAEYNNVLGGDPGNLQQRLIVFRIAECAPIAGLRNMAYVDLVPVLSDSAAFASKVRKTLALREPTSRAGQFSADQQIRHPEIRPFRGFAERDDLLERLDTDLWQGRGAVALRNSDDATVAVHGLGGTGKTVLAKEYAWRNRARYHGLWWLRAELEQTLVDDLVELGKHFLTGLEQMEPLKAAQTVLDQIAQRPTEKPWLLIYDNAEGPADIRRLTPATNAHVLITTRRPDWNAEAGELPISVFDRDTAIDFLMQAQRGDREAAGRLADALDCLPLALSHARAYCRSRNVSFDQYAKDLPKLINKPPKDAPYPASVFATFSLAIDNAAKDCPEAATLMELLAFWAPDQVPHWLIPADVLSPEKLGDAIEALGAVSLIRPETLPNNEPALSVHRLVQVVMRARLAADSRLEKAAAQSAQSTESGYDGSGSFVASERNNYWLPHALAAVAHAPVTGETAWYLLWILNQIGDIRTARGESRAAIGNYRVGLTIANLFAEANPDNAGWQRDLSISYDRVGDVLFAQGDLPEALKSFRDGLAIADRLAGADPDNTEWQRHLSVFYNRVGDVLVAQGKLPEALKPFRDNLAIADRLARADPDNAGWQRDLSVSYNRVGDVLVAQDNLPEALKSFRDSLSIADRLAKADPGNAGSQRDLSISHNKIGGVLVAQGNLPEALKSFRIGLGIADRLAKADPDNAGWQRDLAVAHERIGGIHERQDQTDEAVAAFERALAIYRKLIGRNPDDIQSLLFSVIPLWRLGQLKPHDGRDYLQQALDILRPLAEADRLDARRRGWIPEIEVELAALEK
jgi:tetratricopeptide (TPR) repeat protein